MSLLYRGETFPGYNKPKASAKGNKSHAVVIKDGGKDRLIRFGEKGASTAGAPKAGESAAMTAKRKSFRARHAKNIAKGKTSAAYWSNVTKWSQEVILSLYANIHAKKKRIEAGSGEAMRKAGAKGAPTAKNFKQAAKTAKKRKQNAERQR